jgi:hypothetical protein
MNINQVVTTVSEKIKWIETQFSTYLDNINKWIIEIADAHKTYVNNSAQFIQEKIESLKKKIQEGLKWIKEWIDKQREKLTEWYTGQINKIKANQTEKLKKIAEEKAVAGNPIAAAAKVAEANAANAKEYAESIEKAAKASAEMAKLVDAANSINDIKNNLGDLGLNITVNTAAVSNKVNTEASKLEDEFILDKIRNDEIGELAKQYGFTRAGFRRWLKQNPNGTAEDYVEYLKTQEDLE